jgi:CRP/FNR family transcriptional regulator, cyclic AMP receptor protein
MHGAMDAENLRAVPVFAEMTDEELHRIATFATEDSASAGATLLREGDYSNEMIAVESGTADVMRDGETIASVGPGDVVGEVGVLEKHLRNASVVATSPMRFVRLSNWDVKRLPKETRERLLEIAAERHPATD